MTLFNCKCSHSYGSTAWDFTHEAVKRVGITWNKAMRTLWRLPPNSHNAHLISLNMGSHALDVIYRRFCNLVMKMVTQDKNSKMQFMVLNSIKEAK